MLLLQVLKVPRFHGDETRGMVVKACADANVGHSLKRPNYDLLVRGVLDQFEADHREMFTDPQYSNNQDKYVSFVAQN